MVKLSFKAGTILAYQPSSGSDLGITQRGAKRLEGQSFILNLVVGSWRGKTLISMAYNHHSGVSYTKHLRIFSTQAAVEKSYSLEPLANHDPPVVSISHTNCHSQWVVAIYCNYTWWIIQPAALDCQRESPMIITNQHRKHGHLLGTHQVVI